MWTLFLLFSKFAFYIIFNTSLLDIDYDLNYYLNQGYKCTHRECPWENYDKDIDWGFYLDNGRNISLGTTSNCEVCMARCNNDTRCSSVECGRDQPLPGSIVVKSYCAYWATGKCEVGSELTLDYDSVNNYIFTCKKLGKLKPIQSDMNYNEWLIF